MSQTRFLRLFLLVHTALHVFQLPQQGQAFAPHPSSPRRQVPHHVAPHLLRAETVQETSTEQSVSLLLPDYLVTDSEGLVDRPSLIEFSLRPRELAASSLILAGAAVSASNVLGNYNDSYLALEAVSIVLGFFNAALDYQSSLPPYSEDTTVGVSPNVRSGIVDDALINLYSGFYTASACWLALRTSMLCPGWVTSLDFGIGPLALLTFAFALVCPVLTLMQHHIGGVEQPLRFLVGWARRNEEEESVPETTPPVLSDTELLRARALLGLGIIGCIYSPEVITFLSLGQDWWDRVMSLYPGQPYIESTTALFGVFCTQASMVFHRAGKAGVTTYEYLIPSFGVVCVLLTILPCVAGLYWWGDQMSFFEFYSV